MRAAIAHRAPVPVGVNLAPPIRFWQLVGGAEYLPDEDAVLLPVAGARVVSPWVRVDRPSRILWAEEWWLPVVHGNSSRHISMRYADAAQQQIGVNGNARPAIPGEWIVIAYSLVGGTNRLSEATWCRWEPQVSSTIGSPGMKVRRPTLMIER